MLSAYIVVRKGRLRRRGWCRWRRRIYRRGIFLVVQEKPLVNERRVNLELVKHIFHIFLRARKLLGAVFDFLRWDSAFENDLRAAAFYRYFVLRNLGICMQRDCYGCGNCAVASNKRFLHAGDGNFLFNRALGFRRKLGACGQCGA